MKLIGTYRTPRFRLGDVVFDERRDCDVIIVAISDGRIPWPTGRRRGSSARALVVYGQLADAVRMESNLAVCYWWGVTAQTVSKWRKALGVERTDGTTLLKSALSSRPSMLQALNRTVKRTARDPVRRAKIAAAKRGKPRPRRVIEAMRNRRLGKKHDEAARAKMRAAQKRLGTRPPKAGRPWTADEDQLVIQLTAPEAAKKTGRTLSAVYTRRNDLKNGKETIDTRELAREDI